MNLTTSGTSSITQTGGKIVDTTTNLVLGTGSASLLSVTNDSGTLNVTSTGATAVTYSTPTLSFWAASPVQSAISSSAPAAC